jgi:FKBP-type peptidyl-prolyl cis-trans isomerase (trigger factor)
MPDFVVITVYEVIQQAKYQGLMPQLLDAVIDQKIIAAEARAAAITVTPAELQQSADRLRRQHQLLGAEETFAWLDRHQMSIEDLEAMAQLAGLADKLAQHRFGGFSRESTEHAERQQLGSWIAKLKRDRPIAITLEVLPPPQAPL